MTIWVIVVVFGICMSGALGAGVFFYAQGTAAKNSAILLSRVSSADIAIDDLSIGSHPERLAESERLQRFLKDFPFVQELAELLEQSGRKTTVAQLISEMFVVAGVAAAVTTLTGNGPPAVVFISAFSSVAPIMMTMFARAKRAALLEAQLPHALELINLYLRAGRSLPQAFLAATEELSEPASQEFGLAAEEYRLGRPLDIALKRMALKYPSSIGLRLMAVAVSILGQTGGNLVEVLERIKRLLDATVTYALKIKSMTAESRNSAAILAIIPGVFMAGTALARPDYFASFFNTTIGMILFVLFMGLWLGGMAWIRILVRERNV